MPPKPRPGRARSHVPTRATPTVPKGSKGAATGTTAPPASGRRSRRKGATFERELAAYLRAVYPGARRGIGQTRAGGEVPDVDGTPWWIEAKHRQSINVHAAMAQARAARAVCTDLRQRTKPVLLVLRLERTGDVAVLELEDFLMLMKELERLRDAVIG